MWEVTVRTDMVKPSYGRKASEWQTRRFLDKPTATRWLANMVEGGGYSSGWIDELPPISIAIKGRKT